MEAEPQPERRFKRRVPCRLSIAGRSHPGIVLNVSRGGLFVQTSALPQPGQDVFVHLNVEHRDSIPIGARVVWRRAVASHLRSVTSSGFGVRIERAPDAYYSFLAQIRTPDAARAADRMGEPPATASAGPPGRFRVRVAQANGPRSRVLELEGREAEVRRSALEQCGPDWVVLEVRRSG